MNQIMYDLTYWFDYSVHMVLNHPLVTGATVFGAFLFHQTVGGIKLILSFGLVTVILLELLTF